MNDLRAAAQPALEALEWLKQRGVFGDFDGVTDTLRAALAEPQEPVLQALCEADRIMGHDDEATEWRERWAHLVSTPLQHKQTSKDER